MARRDKRYITSALIEKTLTTNYHAIREESSDEEDPAVVTKYLNAVSFKKNSDQEPPYEFSELAPCM